MVSLRKTFDKRFRLWCSLNHTNIVGLYLVTPDALTLFQEYCENGSLREYWKKELTLNPWIVIRDILGALTFLHDQNPPIVHGNLNPGKIYITRDGIAKIGEFGLSQMVSSFPHLVPSIRVDGMARWMSPECFVNGDIGLNPLNTPLDVWSFGCTLFEVSSIQIPY